MKDTWDTRIAKLRLSADSFVRQQEVHAKVRRGRAAKALPSAVLGSVPDAVRLCGLVTDESCSWKRWLGHVFPSPWAVGTAVGSSSHMLKPRFTGWLQLAVPYGNGALVPRVLVLDGVGGWQLGIAQITEGEAWAAELLSEVLVLPCCHRYHCSSLLAGQLNLDGDQRNRYFPHTSLRSHVQAPD